ncbi:SagB/ThcOx family dehydrogenase [Paenibacillus sediminis]|nr:SagB/ThcOx family dehydrogenase [Paenibacillus sediminis]
MAIQMHASVRVRPTRDSAGQQRWIVDHLGNRQRFSLPVIAVMLLLVCAEPIDEMAALERTGARVTIPIKVLKQLLDNLKQKELLILTTDSRHRNDLEHMASFARHGWQAAWDYLLLTYNYPFVDYAENGRIIDSKRMEEYGKIEPDNSRFKKSPSPLKRISLPVIEASLMSMSVGSAYKPLHHTDWGIQELCNLCAVAFGLTGIINQNQSSHTSEPLYLRTSPSMGARHPVEAYVIVQAVQGLDQGCYHVCVGDHQLDYISSERVGSEFLSTLIPELTEQWNKPPRAILLLTAVFERSMYRYREPHIFRTVHIDVGHLCASVELIARSYGMVLEIFPFNQVLAAERLGAELLTEGGMVAVALW